MNIWYWLISQNIFNIVGKCNIQDILKSPGNSSIYAKNDKRDREIREE